MPRAKKGQRQKKGKDIGIGKGMDKCKLKEKEQKIRKIQKSAKNPKTRVKDDYVKRAKNRLKAMKKANDSGMGEGKQDKNKGSIREMT